MKKKIILLGLCTTIISCHKLEQNTNLSTNYTKKDTAKISGKSEIVNTANNTEEKYNKETVNATTAEKIKTFLNTKFKTELNLLNENDKKFSFYEVDLNGDKKPEYFVRLYGNYFCGSGGCSFYLLNNDFSVNTYFTVTNPPIFRSSEKTNGWNDLILFGDSDAKVGIKNYIYLKFDKVKNKYPNNPSLIKKIDMAPSGHDFVMWHDEFSKAKVFSF